MRSFCFSIDVERDFRADGKLTLRGLTEGLPRFVDRLKSHGVPFDLMISGEIASDVPAELFRQRADLVSLGCHGYSHVPGYLNRMTSPRKEADISRATAAIREATGRVPVHFRAPNFSADGETIRIIEGLGYRVDSSVLPGRVVRKWRVFTLVNHRGAPRDPYTPDPFAFPAPGNSVILEVPVTPNPVIAGGPIGLGFLNAYGPRGCLDAIARASVRHMVFLAHSWEMVSWNDSDPVAPWVRGASNSKTDSVDALISMLDGVEFMNMDRILVSEKQREPLQVVEPETTSSR